VHGSGLTVVVATRNRRPSLLRTLRHLVQLPERPQVLVVDNASTDGTAAAVAKHAPGVRVVRLARNEGAGARTIGAERARSRYVAFSDDDSWWEPGALARAVALLDEHPYVGLLAARVLVGADGTEDPTCRAMAASPLASARRLPGPPVLGFIACGAVVRRQAFLAAGGFHDRLGVGGEETLLAVDLRRTGWELAYAASVVARHFPAEQPRTGRRRTQARNALWTAWLRRPPTGVVRATVRLARRALRDTDTRDGLLAGLAGLPWVLRERDAVPRELELALRAVLD
jgi:GT2 family glycosyltransferase